MPTTDSTGELPPVSESPDTQGMPALSCPPQLLPEQVGPYKVLGLLGAGGMGVVYLAEQERPRRQVALKVMRPGSATPQGLRRFEYEAQALGRLQHAGIARIYEAGTADAGHGPQPYFAMELVRGQPLTAYAEAKRLGIRERLALLVKVCEAVQHAHQKGVIHRDLKPANVLVDEAGQPKVLDFGVARVTDRDVLLTTLHTDVGQLVGTLPYMSPEQAAANPEDVDTRSDVYALGVIGYQLLTGKLPHDLTGKPFAAALRVIGEEDPTPLSSVNRVFRGDLDNVMAKALERDKAQRYQTAADFAADIERYLRDEPIAARRPGAVYHLRKFAKRNKALVSVAALLFLALTGGSWLWARNVLQRERADLAEKEKARLEIEGHAQAARVAERRGQWRDALAHYDQALAGGHGDVVGLRLGKVRALLALHEAGRCLSEIEALAATPNLGDDEGPVLLLHGEILLGRDDAAAERLIRRAQQTGLPPAAAAYAEALLADTTLEAVGHLRRTLALDPYQPRARATLELLLILLARLSEARIELTAHEVLLPDDANAKALGALLLALERDLAGANARLDEPPGQRAAAERTALRALARFLAEFQNPANPPNTMTGLPDLTEHLKALAPAFPHLKRGGDGADSEDLIAALQGFFPDAPLPPRLRKGFAPVLDAWWGAIQAGGDEAGEVGEEERASLRRAVGNLDRAVAVHPEGTVIFMRALMLFALQRFAEADQEARKAAETPALLPVRRHALLIAAAAEVQLFLRDRKDPALFRQATDNMRRMLALGPLRDPSHRNIAVGVALQTQDYSLARQLLDDWERQDPNDASAQYYRALTELQGGAYGPALAAAEKALAHRPNDAGLLQVKKAAVEKIVGQARPFLGDAPKKPAP
jgi:predicted Ser/Thr protein kinase